MSSEKQYQIHPIVHESVVHNTKVLTNLQNLTASLFGVSAGILGLESYAGFLFYLVFCFVTALLFYLFRITPSSVSLRQSQTSGSSNSRFVLLDTSQYFRSAFEFWVGGVFGGLPGFILTWTLFYGLVRA